MGMGRLGQVTSPLLVGAMLGMDWSVSTILTAISVVPLLGGVFCLVRTPVVASRASSAASGEGLPITER